MATTFIGHKHSYISSFASKLATPLLYLSNFNSELHFSQLEQHHRVLDELIFPS